MDSILAGMDGGQKLFLFLGLAWLVVWGIIRLAECFTGSSDELDTDELADRIEAAIKDATVDLLNALESIEGDTARTAVALDRIDERHAESVKPVRISKEI